MSKERLVKTCLISLLFVSAAGGHLYRSDKVRDKSALMQALSTGDKVFSRSDIYRNLFNNSPIKCSVNQFYSLGIHPDQPEKNSGRVKTQYTSKYIDLNGKSHYMRLNIVDLFDEKGKVGFRLKGQTADLYYTQDVNYYVYNGKIEIKINDLRDKYNKTVISTPKDYCQPL